MNATNVGSITHAGLWGLNFTVNSTNYESDWANFTVNITTRTHLNATDSEDKDYNNTLAYENE